MVPYSRKSKQRENVAKIIITSVFLGGFALFIGWMLAGPGLDAFQVGWFDLAILSLATYRMGHLLSYDRVMEPLRGLFTDTIPDSTGAGESVEPKGTGFQNALGQLMCCPICTGTWAAAGMVYALYAFPAPARVFITIMAVVGAAEFLNAAGEMFSWRGQYARTMAGAEAKRQAAAERIVHIETFNGEPLDDLRVESGAYSRRE